LTTRLAVRAQAVTETRFGLAVAKYLVVLPLTCKPINLARRQTSFCNLVFTPAIWVSHMAGSIAGTWMGSRWRTNAFYSPVCILLVSIVVDQMQLLSLEEERDQV
jgi:hypothetical protein